MIFFSRDLFPSAVVPGGGFQREQDPQPTLDNMFMDEKYPALPSSHEDYLLSQHKLASPER